MEVYSDFVMHSLEPFCMKRLVQGNERMADRKGKVFLWDKLRHRDISDIRGEPFVISTCIDLRLPRVFQTVVFPFLLDLVGKENIRLRSLKILTTSSYISLY